MRSISIVVFFAIIVSAKQNVVVFDVAVAEHDVNREMNIKKALKHAFDKYTIDQDTMSAIVFDGKTAHYLFKNVKCVERDRIFLAIDSIRFTVGCADWTLGLNIVDISADNVYLITDENPCGKDPSERALLLKKHGAHIHAIGIGPKIDDKWTKRVGTTHYTSSKYTFPNRQFRRISAKHVIETEPLSAGEIVAVVVISVLFFVLIIFSCWYSCREKPLQKLSRRIINNPRV